MATRRWAARLAAVAMLLGMFLLGIALFAPSARADIPLPGTYEDRRTYYSDSTRTQIVGSWVYDCYGNIWTWGTQSGYVDYERFPCENP